MAIKGKCRVCGKYGGLTKEHVIPQAAGGGRKVKFYSGEELYKAYGKRPEKPYRKIMQNGWVEYSLCRQCNNYFGSKYDTDFAKLFNFITRAVLEKKLDASEDNDGLSAESKGIDARISNIKPFNFAKRVLSSFCSVVQPEFIESNLEIRRAVIDKDYKPNTDKFSLYMKLLTGEDVESSFGFLTVVSNNGHSSTFAGIETSVLAFYLADHNEHKKGGFWEECLDITDFLTDYSYNETASIRLAMKFQRPFGSVFPLN